MYKVQNAFNAGKLSPLLEGRSDLDFYYRGCSQLDNFLVLSQGGIERRPGSEYIDTASQPADGSRGTFVRVVPFEYSTTQAYMLLFGDNYIRIYKDGDRVDNTAQNIEDITDATQVNIEITGHGYSTGDVIYIAGTGGLTPELNGEYVITKVDADNFKLDSTTYSDYSGTWDSAGTATNPVEVTTTFASTDLPNLRFTQSADTLYITSIDHTVSPYKLTRSSDTSWTLTAITFTNGPFIDRDIDASTITPSGNTGSINLTASQATFDSDMVGGFFRLDIPLATQHVSSTATGAGQSSSILVQDGARIILKGTWTGQAQLQRSDDGGTTWENTGPVMSSASDGVLIDEVFAEDDNTKDILYRVNFIAVTSGTAVYTLSTIEPMKFGVVEITGYTDSTHAAATVIRQLGEATATRRYYEGSWSAYRGYPGVMTFFQQRTFWGGTAYQPQTIWGSKTSDFEEMMAGANDNDAVTYTIDSDQVNTIKWMVAHNVLLVGTSGGEWKVYGGGTATPVTPTNVQVTPQSDRGSSDVPGVLLNDAVLFVRKGGKQLRELTYSYEYDTYISPDRTIRAEDITSDVITDLARQKDPNSILWCVLDDGNLISFTYERTEEVYAWAKHTTSGNYESVARIPGTNGDEIYVSVLRTIDGTDYRYIEKFKPRTFSAIADAFFVDAGATITGSGLSSVTNADHLEGEKIAVLGDGSVLYDGTEGAATVSNGTVTLPSGTSVDTIQYGLPYTSTMKTMPLAHPKAQLQGEKKKISEVIAKFIKTQNGKVNGNNGTQDLGVSYSTTVTTKKLPVLNRYDRDGEVQVIQSDPSPMTLIMLGLLFE